MSELQNKLLDEFLDEEYAHGYMEGHAHEKLVAQIYWTRKARKWTQEDLAEKADMTQERVSKIERGEFDSLTMTTLRKLARALDVSLNVGFQPFSHAIVDVCNHSKDDFALKSRVESLRELKESHGTVMQMYGTPIFITAVSEPVETIGSDSTTSSAVTAAPAISYIVQNVAANRRKALA